MGIVIGAIAVYAGLVIPAASAQSAPRNYHYRSIEATLHVNKDSTVSVEERQAFNFIGNYHAAERDISLNKIGAITDLAVRDGVTGQPLARSSLRLDPLNPSSAGKYAVWSEDGFQKVEWYYNLADTDHEWIIDYKVHGAILFEPNDDRLYWNVFSDYTVPVDAASASIILPQDVPSSTVLLAAYRFNGTPIDASFTGRTFLFSTKHIEAGEPFTIDASWQKGVVDEGGYWRDFFALNWLAILGWLIFGGVILYGFFWWLFAIYLKERPGTIIPQYEPPYGLRPAVAEVIVKEAVTAKGFSATIVDLAVRKYVTITEDPQPSFMGKVIIGAVLGIPALLFFGGFTWLFLRAGFFEGGPGGEFFGAMLLVLVAVSVMRSSRVSFLRKDYTITAVKDFKAASDVGQYEKKYLELLFAKGEKNKVSTRDLRSVRGITGEAFAEEMISLRAAIKEEAEKETGAFIDMAKTRFGKKKVGILIVAAVVCAIGSSLISSGFPDALPFAFAAGAIIALAMLKRFTTRRSAEGKKIRDEWLGFKMYLEVADRYRLQNLTPDLFEKYLPYAIVFGIEKKWARAFDVARVNVSSPAWYVVGARSSGAAGTAQGFSASAFSSSFASSFASSFGSSGGGGGAGGGGAGGGAGGGGGGAR